MRSHFMKMLTVFASLVGFSSTAVTAEQAKQLVTVNDPTWAVETTTETGKDVVVIVLRKQQAVAPTAQDDHKTNIAKASEEAKSSIDQETKPAVAGGSESVKDMIAKALPKSDTTANKDIAKIVGQSITSPTLVDIGVTPADFVHPQTVKDVAAALAKGVDLSGKIKEGAAIQINPANVFFSNWVKGGNRYSRSLPMQWVSRTSIELATSKSEDDRVGQQIGAAWSVGLWDSTDPHLLWEDSAVCSLEAVKSLGDDPFSLIPPKIAAKKDSVEYQEAVANLQKRIEPAYNDCLTPKVKNRKLSAARWYAGMVKSWYSTNGEIGNRRPGPRMYWTTFSFAPAAMSNDSYTGELQAGLVHKLDMIVKDPADATKLATENRMQVVGRLRVSRDRWSGFFDIGRSTVHTAGALSENIRSYGYGVEYKLSDDIWLVLGSATETGYSSDKKRTLISTGIRFGQTNQSVIDMKDLPK